jgi:hypothetical protein
MRREIAAEEYPCLCRAVKCSGFGLLYYSQRVVVKSYVLNIAGCYGRQLDIISRGDALYHCNLSYILGVFRFGFLCGDVFRGREVI